MERPDATYDPDADAAYVYILHEPVASTEEIDEDRIVDRAASRAVVGVEFLNVSHGIHVGGLPVSASLLAYRLRQHGLSVLDEKPHTEQGITIPNGTTCVSRFIKHASKPIQTNNLIIIDRSRVEPLLNGSIHVAGAMSEPTFTTEHHQAPTLA